MARELRLWAISLLLLLPATIPYLAHYGNRPAGFAPTGFLMGDMPYYMANAREHFDRGHFQLLYGNPFSPRENTRPIYFQPMTLALGLAWHLTGADPGLIFLTFGFLAAWACVRVAMLLYQEVVGLTTSVQKLGFVLFLWGGGVLALAGMAQSLVVDHYIKDVFRFDPGGGYWFLNLGRNLVFPTEALYHALFLGSVLLTIRRRYGSASMLALVVSLSHPFTGVELAAILWCWAAVEVFFMENRGVPRWFFGTISAVLAFHFAYYLVFLRASQEHRLLMKQWELAWTIEAVSFVPAYLLVGSLAVWALRRYKLASELLAAPQNRLFLVWFLVAFALSNHEFAVKPVQPLHFTRGYEWTALFLLGSGPLIALLSALSQPSRRPLGLIGAGLLVAVFLSDNVLWLGSFTPLGLRRGAVVGLFLSPEQRPVLSVLNAPENRGRLVLSQDKPLGYFATVYTPLRSWYSHASNTPDANRRRIELNDLFDRGRFLSAWDSRPLVVVTRAGLPEPLWLIARHPEKVFDGKFYRVYRVTPTHLARK